MIKNKFKIGAIALTALVTLNTVMAQTVDKPWSVGLYAGKSEYNGCKLGNGFFNYSQALYGFGALSLSRYVNKSFDVQLYGSYGQHGFVKDAAANFLNKSVNADVTLRYKFVKKDDAKLVPYIFAGLGLRSMSTVYSNNPNLDLVIPVGLGLDYHVTSSIAIRYFGSVGFSNHGYGYSVASHSDDKQLQHNLGIAFNFGKKKDADKDGVADSKDKCPNSPAGQIVGKDGCMLDRDKDGIADNEDVCPDVAGVATAKGCPDKDGDGITDKDDACPDVKGVAAFKGCPDTDGDGVEDSKDKCPTVAGLKEMAGCPDRDGDGIADNDDACPDVKGTVAMQGCPDTDGDGVVDKDDKCPTVVGTVANKGCPEVSEKAKAVFEKALTGIQFESGKDVIKPSSFGILNNVAEIMLENPSYKLKIDGHTDDQGDDAKNKTLSQKRAEAVLKYLETKKVAANRMMPEGFGEERPIADNKTAEGRARNRRVEFKVEY
ncbi:MAG TPA: OmpA family protein [Bacteroidia bacterium]|jgi:OOP family OmpA-OmpF porin|nr:OmpA family protein [Bacteroidia bacterium]